MQADKILKLVRLTEKSNKLSSTLGRPWRLRLFLPR